MREKSIPDGLCPTEGTDAGAGSEEEGAAETMQGGLTTAPIPLCCWRGGGGEIGSEVEPGKKEVGEDVCKIRFCFSLSDSDSIGDNLNFFPQVQSILPVTAIGEWSLPVLISTLELFIIFFLPRSAEDRE